MRNNVDVLKSLRDVCCDYVRDFVPDCWDALSQDRCLTIDPTPNTPRDLPVTQLLPGFQTSVSSKTRTVYEAIVESASHVEWRQTYDTSDGFSKAYLDLYGWFHVASPRGPFRTPSIALDICIFGHGLDYRTHWHEPAEFYMIIAGACQIDVDGFPPRFVGPGDTVFVPAGAHHRLVFADSACLILDVRYGGDLLAKSHLV